MERQLKALPFSTATVKQDVPDELVWYLLEHQDEFRGVAVEQVFLREYPHHELGAHLFGYVGEVSEAQLEDPRFRDVELGDRIGKAGVEDEVTASSADTMERAACRSTPSGTLTAGCPRASRSGAPAAARRRPRRAARGPGGARRRDRPGAFAVVDVHTGEVLGLGSQPSFDPNGIREGRPGNPTTSG